LIVEDCGHSVTERECGELLAPRVEKVIRANHKRFDAELSQRCEDGVDVGFGTGMQNMKL
jgi:hypothetical protein